MLKKTASGVLATLPCPRTENTLRVSKWLRPCRADFFDLPPVAEVDFVWDIYWLLKRNIPQAPTRKWVA
jgi:hypothetical protein